MTKNFLFTSESVSEGHPDKIADQIYDKYNHCRFGAPFGLGSQVRIKRRSNHKVDNGPNRPKYPVGRSQGRFCQSFIPSVHRDLLLSFSFLFLDPFCKPLWRPPSCPFNKAPFVAQIKSSIGLNRLAWHPVGLGHCLNEFGEAYIGNGWGRELTRNDCGLMVRNLLISKQELLI